jgi:hypothetical protein
MKPQVLIDLGALVALIVGFIVITRAIRKSIKDEVAPHIDQLKTTVTTLKKELTEIKDTMLLEERHEDICTTTRTMITALEKSLCGKLQILINLVGIQGHSKDEGNPGNTAS